MKRFSSAVTLSLLFTLPTLAQNFTSFEVDPPDPTSKDPVTLIVRYFESCPPPPDVVRDDFDIDITLHSSICASPPHLLEYHLDIGTLPAGQYTVTVHNPSGKPGIETFTVLDANSSIVIAPSLGPTSGGTVVDIAFSGGFCIGREPTTCPLPTITFGGVAATNVAIVDYAHFRATTPPHAAGPVLVTINGDSLQAQSYAFRYYDPSADPSPKFFEKVLIPVIMNGPGANGSQWATEAWLRNNNAQAIQPFGATAMAPSIPVSLSSDNAPTGKFVVLPRESSGNVEIHEIVRDTSLADGDFGAEIPIAHERDFSTSIDLLGVPIDPRFRLTLRIYAPQTQFGPLRVSIYDFKDGQPLRNFDVQMTAATADEPAFASLSNFVAGLAASPRAGIRITAPGFVPVWAFLTITNNETQHVTVISPR